MKPQLFHHLLARLLTASALTLDYDKSSNVVSNLKAIHEIPDLGTLGLASTEAYYYWPLTICYRCGTIWKDWPSATLLSPVCPDCQKVNKSFYSADNHSAGWLVRELVQLPTVHKRMLVEAINYGQYLRTTNGTVSLSWRTPDISDRGLEREKFTGTMEQIPEDNGKSPGSGGTSRRENSEDNLQGYGVGETSSLAALRKAKILRDINRRNGGKFGRGKEE